MAKTLKRTVFVDEVAYGPSSAIPEAVAKRITNPKAWADADASAPAPAGVVSAPAEHPVDRPPSDDWTVKELKAFAKQHDVALGEARAKDQILVVLAEAGHGAAEPAPEGAEDGQSEDADGEESEQDSDDTDGADEA